MHLDMDDLRHGDGRGGNDDDDGGHMVLSVVPFREEDAAFLKVAGDAEENEEEDGGTRLRGSFRLLEGGDGGTDMSQKNSREWTGCWCVRKAPEPEHEDDTEARAAPSGKLISFTRVKCTCKTSLVLLNRAV